MGTEPKNDADVPALMLPAGSYEHDKLVAALGKKPAAKDSPEDHLAKAVDAAHVKAFDPGSSADRDGHALVERETEIGDETLKEVIQVYHPKAKDVVEEPVPSAVSSTTPTN